MKDHEGCVRGFHWGTRTWYASERDQAIMFGMYDPNGGGTTGEMAMRWHDLDGMVPRLEVFCDAWDALQQFTDVLAILAGHDGENITEEKFVNILKSCGVQDLTAYESPYPSQELKLRQRLAELQAEVRKIEEQLQ